jgi:hypothetical protein
MKIIAIILFLFSTLAYATPMPTSDKPFLRLGGSSDGNTSIYIGAYGDLLPQKLTQPGDSDIVLIGMTYQDYAEPGHKQGESVEFTVVASCSKQLVKVLPIWVKYSSDEPGKSRYNLSGKKLADKIAAEINKEPAEVLDPTSLLFLLVGSGCHYLHEDLNVKVKPNVKLMKTDKWI